MSLEGAPIMPSIIMQRIEADGEEREVSDVRLRKMSDVSQKSAPNEVKSTVLAYDSGNYSTSSNASEVACPFEMELHNHCQHVHTLLRERDQALFLAMQDVRKLRSELERLNKSEDWYKKELRAQKRTRLEALERLYSQERKYMQENQRLQRECVRLYDKCGEMEKELQVKREKAVQKLVEKEEQHKSTNCVDKKGKSFELEQQRSMIDDQQKLINVLRKQKHVLLEDLRKLNEEKDTKVLELQETLAGVEVENTRMTAQCKRLLTERQALEDTLQTKDAALYAENSEKLKLQTLIEELKELCNLQQQELARKENEICETREKFKCNMQNETNMDEVHRLSITYHDDINAKTAEITSLKKSLQAIRIELSSLTEIQAQNEQQERQIEHLNFALETRQCELSNLQETDEQKTQQINELQQNLEKVRTQHDITLENLHSTESSLKSVKHELIALHEQYASMCALCERTRFELELLEIEKNKLRFQADSDKREIELLRGKLRGYLKHTEKLGARINELENKLKCSTIESEDLQVEFSELEKRSIDGPLEKEKVEKELKSIQRVLHQNREVINRLNKDNEFLRASKDAEKFAEDVNQVEEGDSGFLDVTECEINDKVEPDSQTIRESVCSNLKYASNSLLEHLSSQEEMLKERRTLIAAFENLICNEAASIEVNKDLCTENVQDKQCDDALLERQEQLMEYLNNQSLLTLEKRELLESFETLINEETGPQEISINNQKIFEMKKLIEENKKLKILLTTIKEPPIEVESLKLALTEKNAKCLELEKSVSDYSDELQNLQTKLLQCDERHEKDKSEEDNRHRAQLQSYEDTIQRLQAENERLLSELQNVLAAKSNVENTLEKQKLFVQELKAKLVSLEKNKNSSEVSNSEQTMSFEQQEVLNLRMKVEELETRLQAVMQCDEERRNDRVRLIQQLLEQQSSKVKQLSESQEEWEELLTALQTAQKLEENTRAELQLKHVELDELNSLFAQQNEELRRMHEIALLSNGNGNEEEIEKLRPTLLQQYEEMHANLSAQLADSKSKQRQIEELQEKNERLERHLNEDYATEVAKNQRQLRALQTKIETLQAERNSYAERLAEMEIEMQQLKKSKREALVLPPEFVVLPQTAGTASSTAEASSLSEDGNANMSNSDNNNDHMRILTKVLEAEYRRKMKRYDVYIHTLLGNIKKLKKALRAAETRAAHLTMEQSRTMDELRGLQLTRRQLEETRLKCDNNQITIKTLERALEMERRKFEASDLGKATYTRAAIALQRDEPAHEVANLIDDYKKLIQQSALATQRPKTNAILDLIQRSNQCVPNLYKLETTVEGLSSDLKRLLSAHALSANKLEAPSLMDELRAAAESY
ncbi:early endosome antigen 1 [Anastrepha obliqua]|uniref:early endosome antigen 1 n=1 Tax=Anastrepha obliqua TaxID=95512 RepID=UPI0024097CA0|nr:early endosome antigen 1 [Anastrepha obliqua]